MVVKNSFIYLGAEILNKAIPFLLLPIITKYLTPQEYGIYGIYQVLLSFLTPFLSMSLDINITRNFFKVSKEKLSTILSSLISILHLNLFLGLITVYIISLFFENPFGVPNKILMIMPIIIFAQTMNTFNLTILRNEQKAMRYGFFQIILTIINFSSTLLLLLVFHKNWESLVYGILIAHVILMLYTLYCLKNEYKLSFNFYSFKEIYKISLSLIFHLLGGSIIFLSDRLFIQQMEGLKEVGLYSIGNQFGVITMIVLNAIIMAINPWMYKKLADKINIKREIYLLMFFFSCIGLVVWQSSLVVFPYVVDSKYHEAKQVIVWISMAFVFRGWYQLYYNVVLDAGKTIVFMYITFGSGILNLILNYILIKQNGMVGASQATVIAFFTMYISLSIYSKKINLGKK